MALNAFEFFGTEKAVRHKTQLRCLVIHITSKRWYGFGKTYLHKSISLICSRRDFWFFVLFVCLFLRFLGIFCADHHASANRNNFLLPFLIWMFWVFFHLFHWLELAALSWRRVLRTDILVFFPILGGKY